MHTTNENSLSVEITVDLEITTPINEALLAQAVRQAAQSLGFQRGEIGIRVTTDAAIQVINQKHLSHDFPTDVISFGYRSDAPALQGEMVVSVDTARSRAAELGWSIDHELCLYVVHGTLHITGMDDHEDQDRFEMRKAETVVMKALGIDDIVRFGVDAPAASHPESVTAQPESATERNA